MKKNHWNDPLFVGVCIIYMGMLVLFASQTWGLVSWLFPADNLFMKLTTLAMFDIMAFVWGYIHTFYSFHARAAKQWVFAGATICFILSFIATVLYMTIENIFRFHLPVDQGTVNFGYGVTIAAVVVNIFTATFFLLKEFRAKRPHLDYFEVAEQQAAIEQENSNTQANNGQLLLAPRTFANTGQLAGQYGNTGTFPIATGQQGQQANNVQFAGQYANSVVVLQTRTRNTKQRTAALAIVNKYGQETVLSNLEGYAKEAGISPRTLKRYAQGE